MGKIIKLEDFNDRSLDDIIELYRSGYILEGAQPSIQQMQIQQMQWPSYSTAIAVLLAGTLMGLVITLALKRK
jgi:hypothetical protein